MTVDDYMKVNYPLMIKEIHDEGQQFYEFKIPDLPGLVIFTDSIEEGYKEIEDAKRCWLTLAYRMGITIPKPTIDVNKLIKDT